MPVEFDPAWEYYQPDPEVAEAVYGTGRGGPVPWMTWFVEMRPAGMGVSSRPGVYHSRLGPEKPIRQGKHFDLRLCPGCDRFFRPAREGQGRCCRGPSPARPERPCGWCGAGFTPQRAGARFCRPVCASAARALPERECRRCRRPFKPRTRGQVRCGRRCAATRRCKGCGEEFVRLFGRQSCCSGPCALLRGGLRVRPQAIVCGACGEPTAPKRVGQRYCSRKCSRSASGSGRVKAAVPARPCGWCRAEFTPQRPCMSAARFCCKSHARLAYHAARRQEGEGVRP